MSQFRSPQPLPDQLWEPPDDTGYQQWQQAPSQPLLPRRPFEQPPVTPPPSLLLRQAFPMSLPPQQSQAQPPPAKLPTPRKSFKPSWLWLITGLVIGAIIGYAAHIPGSQATPAGTSSQISNQQTTSAQQASTPLDQPTRAQSPTQVTGTPASVHTPAWTTVQTFTGNGDQKTALFSVPGDWKILWNCDPNSFVGPYNVQLNVYNLYGIVIDANAINAICQAGNTSGGTEVHQGGQVYLLMVSESVWKIQVQALK
ncbi:MAG TPA: hypothetical protein VKR83_02880 [Ktedonobacteraceae bacterium]|nr:hypothetical protein [Ktedonobacteraceae bacterium]